MDNNLQHLLKEALINFTGEGANCICNATIKDDCVCHANWATKQEIFLENKLDHAINALIEATNDIHDISRRLNKKDFDELEVDELIKKYDNIADSLEDNNNPIDSII
jgi:hypothetical protein